MKELSLDVERRQLIEQIALFNERQGLQPAAARVLGLLMVSERENLSFEEIQTALKLSKSAVSQSLSLLGSLRQVEPLTLPGERRRYFRLRPDGWRFHMESTIEGTLDYSNILRQLMRLRQDQDSAMCRSLHELVELLELLHRTLRETVQKWQAAR
jgi:DNA-binding transcriptional regulator GbsR (MarR family)